MGKVIEFKKHPQREECSSYISMNNKLLERVYDFDCPIPLYSDEDGQLFIVFYNLADDRTMIAPYFDSIESMVEYEKNKSQTMKVPSSELF